jgi:hypothetical protein
MTNSIKRKPVSLLTAATLAAMTVSCNQKVNCPELGSCGGPPPLGSWVLDPGHPSCIEDLYIPPTDTRLLGGEVPPARTPAVEPAFFDWCNLLVATASDIKMKSPRFFYESGPVGAATVTYNADGTFSAGITRTGTFYMVFPAVCMHAFGAMNNATGNVCDQLSQPLKDAGEGEGAYQNTVCFPDPDEPAGCRCTFDVTETGGPAGKYLISGSTITHLFVSNFPAEATYCNKGNGLELTGKNGSWLFNQPGLRTLDLAGGTAPPATP